MIKKILRTSEEIQERIEKLANQINSDYSGLELNVVCLSNSALTFAADLLRQVQVPVRKHLLSFETYSTTPESGEVRLFLDIDEPLYGKHVLVLEGMVISGRTPQYILNMLRIRQPSSLEICVIGFKPLKLVAEFPIKYSLFEFGDEWVTGYGIGSGNEKVSMNLIDARNNKIND